MYVHIILQVFFKTFARALINIVFNNVSETILLLCSYYKEIYLYGRSNYFWKTLRNNKKIVRNNPYLIARENMIVIPN